MEATDENWVCQCRQCNGVANGGEAVQYVWEFVLGACGVPLVASVNAADDGFVYCAFVYWHDEPDEADVLGDTEYVVSCRPGDGTVPTEGDIARWMRWAACDHPPADWLIADGLRFRSVRGVVEALRAREPMPAESTIAGDWDGPSTMEEFRRETRKNWAVTKKRNQAFRRP